MKILACIPLHYYSSLSVTFSYYYVAETLRKMGHTVHVFEFIEQKPYNKDGMNEFFSDVVAKQGYDLVFVETSTDEFYPETLDEVRSRTVTLAWNSDDDWRWDTYSSRWCPHFSYMVTTYRHIYDQNHGEHPNLMLSQWACTGLFDGAGVAKDIPFSFVGGVYPERASVLRVLSRRAGLRVFSQASLLGNGQIDRGRRKLAALAYGGRIQPGNLPLDYPGVNDIWNRTRVSLTPLEASRSGHLQVKGRVFEMGLSGTAMVCSRNPDLRRFYEPGVEYLEYGDSDECLGQVRRLLADEGLRRTIADAYRRRTLAEHMWSQRYREIFGIIGLPA